MIIWILYIFIVHVMDGNFATANESTTSGSTSIVYTNFKGVFGLGEVAEGLFIATSFTFVVACNIGFGNVITLLTKVYIMNLDYYVVTLILIYRK